MKIRLIKITPERFIQLLQGKTFTSNLPSDTEVLDIKMDLFSNQVSIIIRSESFENVAETAQFPEFTLTTPPEPKNITKSVVPATPEAKIDSKPALTKLVPSRPDPSRYATKMENEFSPEQRKLLTFTVRDDVVVVKPVTFLKAEWEDINEVVRSLGGKWVKGDIISFWEIPL